MTTIVHPDGSSLTLDATTRIVVMDGDLLSSHPIEGGIAVSDHVQAQPRAVQVSGLLTESPREDQSDTGGPDHVRQAIEFLTKCRGERLTLLLDDREGQIDNMALIRIPRTLRRFRDVPIDLEFAEVRVAEAGTVRLEAAERQANGADPSVDAGEQATSETSSTTADQDSSVLVALFGG